MIGWTSGMVFLKVRTKGCTACVYFSGWPMSSEQFTETEEFRDGHKLQILSLFCAISFIVALFLERN